MADAFARMHTRLFARLGQEALLRGLPTVAIVEHGVAVTGEYGQVTGYRSFATLPVDPLPKVGDTLVVDTVSSVIDAIQENDGHTVSVVLR
jgi:hypothetical protein